MNGGSLLVRCFICLLFSLVSLWAGANTKIRVRLFHQERVTVEGQIQIIKDKILRGQKISLSSRAGKPVWRLESWFGGPAVEGHDFPLIVQGTALESGFQRLPPTIKVFAIAEDEKLKRFDVVGTFELEDYLSGVLASEMPLSWPLEALKAQVIASRTYALKQLEKRKSEHFDVDSTVKDQVYRYDTYMSPEKRKNLTDALTQTKGLILADLSGEIVETFYHSDCGGKTDGSLAVWKVGQGKSVSIDKGCALRPSSVWEHRMNIDEFVKRVKSEFSEVTHDKLVSISPGNRTPGGRLSNLNLVFGNGRALNLSATRVRELVGYGKMKSTRFVATVTDETIIFKGRGFGHGVGLCQWGTKDLANEGKSFKDILFHYFPKTQVSRLTPSDTVAAATF